MGTCGVKELTILSNKEQVEFIRQINLILNDLDTTVENLKEEEVHYKMIRYLFILNCVKDINQYIELIESGKKCFPEVKDLLVNILESVKDNNRSSYNKHMSDMKELFLN